MNADEIVVFQPAPHVDNIVDGEEMTQRPYPFAVDATGAVIGRRDMVALIGAVADPARQQIDIHSPELLADPQQAVGMYLITSDGAGKWSTHVTAIETATVHQRGE
jgi:hypothetical protein